MGADYKQRPKAIMGGAVIGAIVANRTSWVNPSGGDDQAGGAGIGNAEMPMAYPCIIRNLVFDVSLAPGAGETFDYTLYVNGVPTALTCQIAGAVATGAFDMVNAIVIGLHDLVCIEIVTSLNAVAAFHKWSIEIDQI